MPKQKAKLPLEEIYPLVEDLSTEDQMKLKEYLEGRLESKKIKAKEEYDLINSNGKK